MFECRLFYMYKPTVHFVTAVSRLNAVLYQMSLKELNGDVNVPPKAVDYVRRRINEALIKNGTIDMAIKSQNSSKIVNRHQQAPRYVSFRL